MTMERDSVIFVFVEDGTLDIIEDLEEARRDYEGIDVESNLVVFYDENGVYLQPHFIVPNKHGSIFGLFEWGESGIFELKPNPENDEDPIRLKLYETSSLNENPFFKTLDEVKSFLASKGVKIEAPT